MTAVAEHTETNWDLELFELVQDQRPKEMCTSLFCKERRGRIQPHEAAWEVHYSCGHGGFWCEDRRADYFQLDQGDMRLICGRCSNQKGIYWYISVATWVKL